MVWARAEYRRSDECSEDDHGGMTIVCLTGGHLYMAGWLLGWSPAIRNTSFVKAGGEAMMFVHCPDPARGPAEEETICNLCRWRIIKNRGVLVLGWPFVACGWEVRN